MTLPPLVTGRLRNTKSFVANPLGFLSTASGQHGDVFRFQMLNGTMLGVTHPHHIKYMLQERITNFTRRTAMYDMIEPFIGRGLASVADHQRWRRNRRLAQPAFHRKKISAMSEIMTAEVEALCERWTAHAQAGDAVNVGEEMSELTVRIVVRALFAMDPTGPEVTGFAAATHRANLELGKFAQMPLIPLRVPTPSHRRFWHEVDEMNRIVYGVIAAVREDPDNDGLLSMFMNAVDEDTGETLTDAELRDEVVTMLFAGHETSASALTSAALLRRLNPDVDERLRAEVDGALTGAATMADLPKLAYTKQILDETLRLMPPAWMGQRIAEADDEIAGYRIPAGTTVVFSYYHALRHAEFWDSPDTFNPDRFTPDAVATRDRNAYLPFGVGGHQCIGNAFAQMEMQIALATIARRFTLTIDNPDLTPLAALTLGTKTPVLATISER